MNKFFILLATAFLFAACNPTTKSESNDEQISEESPATFIPLKEIQSKAINFIDQEIQTQGIADHTCKHGGKKILLVDDDISVHVFSEDRFDDNITGKEIKINGIVREVRTDEASLLKLEENAINSHSSGEDAELRQERTIMYVNMMRDSLKNMGVDHFSEYSLEYVSHEEVK